MRILALDLAATTGWATCCGRFGNRAFAWKKKPYGARWLEFYDWLAELVHDIQPGAIVLEEAIHRGKAATRQLKSLMAVAEMLAAAKGVPCQSVNVTTIKRHATGKAKASKQEMLDAARRAGLDQNVGHDEVDALWLCHYAISENLFQ